MPSRVICGSLCAFYVSNLSLVLYKYFSLNVSIFDNILCLPLEKISNFYSQIAPINILFEKDCQFLSIERINANERT